MGKYNRLHPANGELPHLLMHACHVGNHCSCKTKNKNILNEQGIGTSRVGSVKMKKKKKKKDMQQEIKVDYEHKRTNP